MKKYPSAPALFCQKDLVLLIIKILLLSIVRDHDLVFSDIPKVIMTLPDLEFNACKYFSNGVQRSLMHKSKCPIS